MRYIKKSSLLAQVSVLVIASLTPVAAQAQTTPDEQATERADDKASGDEEVVVTGSRLKRSTAEGPTPVTVISTEQMRKQGFSTVYDALQTTTEAIGNVQNDYDWGQSSVNAYPLNLRNLGPGRTLLLVNGHRVADYPMPYQGKSNFANFNNLPTGIVNRVEILSGAASAIYGSDAMGGVVNVILNDKAEGHTARFRYGGATRGGRETYEAVLSGGFSGENWNILYNLQHYSRGTLLAKKRPFMDGEDDRNYADWGPAERHFKLGRLNPSTGIRMLDAAATETVGRPIYVTPPNGACDQYGSLNYLTERLAYNRNTGAETRDGFYCGTRVFQNWALRTGSKDYSGYLHTNAEVGSGITMWASAGWWRTTGGFNTFMDGFISPTDYWDPRAGGGARNVFKRFAPEELNDGTLTRSKETALDLSAGLKGKLFDDVWSWEIMVGAAKYSVNESFPTLNQGKMFEFFMGPQQGTLEHPTLGTLPVYSPDYNKLWNPLSPSDADAFTSRGLKKARSSMQQAQAVLSGKLFDGWAGPIQLAAVVEAGRQSYLLTPDPKTLNQDADGWYTPFGNIEQGGGTRNRYAGGLELGIPLFKGFELTAAGRYDKYDAVASDAAFTYQFGAEYRPAKNLLIRGSYGTAFRAPDMHFVYAQPSTGISDFTDYSACFRAGFPNNQCLREDFLIDDATVARQGTPNLLYEKGKSWSAGVVWDAFRNFSASVDYWKIDINNLIDDVSAEQVLLDEAFCQYGKTPDNSPRNPGPSQALCELQISRVIRNAAGVVTQINTGPVNRARTSVQGIDAKVSYRVPTQSMGSFTLSGAYTVQLKFRQQQFPTDPFENTIGNQNPRARFNATLAWNKDKASAALYMFGKTGGRNNRWEGCDNFDDGFRPSPGNQCKDLDPASPTFGQSTELLKDHRKPRIYFNASAGYDLTSWIRFNVYGSNIFDKIYGDKYCGDFAYCIDDPVGRELAAEVVVKF